MRKKGELSVFVEGSRTRIVRIGGWFVVRSIVFAGTAHPSPVCDPAGFDFIEPDIEPDMRPDIRPDFGDQPTAGRNMDYE
jgi:hypothetical protein